MNGARLRRKAIAFVASLLGCAAAATGGAVAQPLPHTKPEAVGFSSPKLKKLDETMQAMVDKGHVAGAVTLLARHGRIVQTAAFGKRGLEADDPMPANAIFRIRSETKPVTGVAMMILYDEGRWKLDDPVSKYVPEFANLRVATMDSEGRPVLKPISRPPTMRELMTHTAGFAYGIADDPSSPADQAYYKASVLQSESLDQLVRKVSDLPMFAEPGTLWRYSIAADIQGYIVEKLSGQSLPVFMQERIFTPLGMGDTAFYVPEEKVGRLAGLYDADPAGRLVPVVEGSWRDVTRPPLAPSGGGGLVSTAHDFARFAQMLLNGGDLDGVRILQPETVALMRLNQLPPSFTVTTNGTANVLQPSQKPFPFAAGMGYGLDVAVAVDPAASGAPVGPGTFGWGGSAGTWFWIDPVNDLFFIGMIQRLGGVGSGLDATTRTLVYQALEHPDQ
ncbi:MAG: beta-lactamase family protein [Alphaproteobacteria bacterium]|nr:beta-lactamase family protein [Alphaproteobacteria bacterium]